MKPRASDSERVIDYLTALARDQDVHVVTLDAIIGACDIRPLKWPNLFEKHLKDTVEAVPGRDAAYRLRKKRSDLMTRLTDEERVVDHLLKVGSASPADIRRALGLAESDTKEILHRLSQDGRAQHEGRGRGVRWSLVETRPVPPPVEATPVVEERDLPTVDEWADMEREDVAASAKPQGGVDAPAPSVAPNGIPVRSAARCRMPLDGADAQALEGALQLTEAERDAAREEAAGWKARAERALAEGQAAAAQLERKRIEVLDLNRQHSTRIERLVGERDRAEDLLEVVYKALGLTKETASDEAITKAIAGLLANHSSVTLSWDSPRLVATEGEVAAAARTIAGLAASTTPDGRIPYEVLEQRLAHYRRAWCDLAGAVTGTPTDKAGEHGEMEVGAVLAIATRRRVDADTAADLPAIIDRLAKERDEARSQRDELERRAEATNDALWELRRKARRNLDRARIKLADAQNRLDAIESVPLAGDPIPF